MKRENVEYRDNLYKDFDLQQYVLMKSDDRCCHCGRKSYFPTNLYHASIDHFIPLSQGGTNRKHNLIMLCEECNKEKGQKIVDINYLPYLLPKYKEEIEDYYNSYISSFEYMTRNRLFASDEYKVYVDKTPSSLVKSRHTKGVANAKWLHKPYALKRSDENDFHRLTDFLRIYSEKNDIPHEIAAIKAQIAFWQKFGAIYYMEDAGEISLLIAMVLTPTYPLMQITEPYILTIYPFSRSSSHTAGLTVITSLSDVPYMIMKEQKLSRLTVQVRMSVQDSLSGKILLAMTEDSRIIDRYMNGFYSLRYRISVNDTEGKTDVGEFMKKFTLDEKAKKSIAKYYGKYMEPGLNWLLYDLLTPEELEKYGAFEEGTDAYDLNQRLVKNCTEHKGLYKPQANGMINIIKDTRKAFDQYGT